jgi:hypothetical protein
MRDCSLEVIDGINMKFSRKLIVREGSYGTISVPKPVLDAWASVEDVEMEFNERSNTLVIMPKQERDGNEHI